MAAKTDPTRKIVADNRKARFNYEIGDVIEAGIALMGSEVKSLRMGKANIAESYAAARDGELWLLNANITEHKQAGPVNHAPKRARKLLLHKRQINKLIGAVEREGMTVVPLKLYFNEKGRAKIEIALARGKKLHDKRETEKKRSWERERGRLMRAKSGERIGPGDLRKRPVIAAGRPVAGLAVKARAQDHLKPCNCATACVTLGARLFLQ